jgi:PAS domain S-box-containing protein
VIRKKLFVVIIAKIITVVSLVNAVQTVDLSVKPVYAAAKDAKLGRVLYLNSYDRGYKWSNDIERGLVERLKNADREIELSVEYLDGRRFPGTARNDLLAATLAAKYAGYRHDIVVVSDNFAFDFAIQYRKQLFPDLPIVFCGYNNFRPDMLKGIRNITGVNEEVDFARTVDLAIRVQPGVRNLVFITSTGDDSNRRMTAVAEATLFPELRKGYNVVALKDASMAEIGSRLGVLPRDSAVFLVGMTRDLIEGRRPTSVENGCMILAVSPVPVYAFWDFHLGTGILGGYIIAGLDQGRTAADMVLRILGGTPADSIPVMMHTPARNMIDFNVMKKFGIKLNALPEGCSFINRPVSLWENYGWYIGAALLAMSLESLLIVALVLSLRQRKEAFRMLGIERDLLEQRVEERTGELEHSLSLLSASLESTVDGILIEDGQGKITRWNQKFAGMWDMQKEVLSNLDVENARSHILTLLADPEQFEAKVRELQEHPEQTSFEQIELTSGRVFERYSQPQRIEDNIVGRVWSFRDITERKRAEEQVRRSEAKYRNLLENIPQKIFYKNRDSIYAAVNPSYAKDFGMLPEDFVGKTDYDFFPNELADKYRTDDQRVMTQGATEELDESYISGDEEKSIHTVKTPVYDEYGTITGVLGIFWDITERKRAEEALQQAHDELEDRVTMRTKALLRANEALRSEIAERKRAEDALRKSEQKYRLVADNSNDWIYLINPDGKFQYVSPSSERITGYSYAQFLNDPQLFQNIIHPDDKEKVTSHHATVSKETKTGNLEFRIVTKDGELRWIMHSCLPVYDDEGEYIGQSGTNRDFTERKHAEDALQWLSSRLLTCQEQEQRRIAMELHDQTGQDIIFLKLQLQALKNRLERDQTNLKKECDKILTLTDRIIEDVRRLAHGLSPSQLQALGLCAALKALIHNFSEKTLIPICYDVETLDNEFRPETEIVLYRIFQEALTNIYKHARAKKVWIDVCRQGNSLLISIKDDGRGFDSGHHLTSEPAVERGMGLSALELRSRMIGADLKISSQPSQGTEINLSVPINGNPQFALKRWPIVGKP